MTTLERLLGQVTALEELVDAQCRRCRITRTHASLKAALVADELDELPTNVSASPAVKRKGPAETIATGSNVASSSGAFAALADSTALASPDKNPPTDGSGQTKAKRKRERAGRRELEQRRARLAEVERLMAESRWEADVEGVQWALVDGGVSTRCVPLPLPRESCIV